MDQPQGWSGRPEQEPAPHTVPGTPPTAPYGAHPATPYAPPPVPPQGIPVPPAAPYAPATGQSQHPAYLPEQRPAQPQYAPQQPPYAQPQPRYGPPQYGPPQYGPPQYGPPAYAQPQPPYAPGAPYPYPAPRPSLAARLRLTGDDVTTALKVAGWALLPALAGLTVIVAIVAGSTLDSQYSGSLADWLRTAVVLLVMALGGRLTLDGSLGSSAGSADLTVGLRLMPLLVTVVVLAVAARVSMRAERRSPSVTVQQLLARAGLAGLVAGVGALIVAALSRSSDVYGVDLAKELAVARTSGDVGAGLVGAFVGAALFVFATAAVARVVTSPTVPVPLPGALGTLRGSADLAIALRVLRSFAVGLAGAGAIAVVGYYLDRALFSDTFDGVGFPVFVGLLVLCVNGVGAAVLGAFGVPVTWSGNAGGRGDLGDLLPGLGGSGSVNSDGTWSLFDQPVLLLALLVPVVLILATAVRRTLRQIPFVVTGRAVGYGAVVGAVGGFALALLLRISVGASASGATAVGSLHGDGSATTGFSLLWAPLLGAAWCALAVWAARFGGTLALSLPAAVIRRIGGTRTAPHWAAALAGAAPAPAGRRSRGVRATALAAVVVAALGVLGTGVVALVNGTVYTPEAAAKSYLTALASGDVSAVASRLSSGSRATSGNAPLLSSAVRAGKDFVPIRTVAVGAVHEYGGATATVQVSYLIGSDRHTESIDLVRGADSFGMLHTWKVASSLPSVTVDGGNGLRAAIGGEQIGAGTYAALPGRYTFHPVDTDYLTADATGVDVGLGGTASLSFDPTLRSDVVTKATQAVQAQLQKCLAATSWPQPDCPFLSSSTDLQGLSLGLVTAPTFTLEYDENGNRLDIVTQSRGDLHVAGTMVQDWFGTTTSTPYEDEFSFDVDGSVDVHGDQVEVSFG